MYQRFPAFMCLGFILFVKSSAVPISLVRPSFESTWYAFAAQDPYRRNITITHALGEYPVKVDVQIKVKTNGKEYIFTGIGSGHRDDDIDEDYGGTVYIYNQHEFVITSPFKNNNSGKGGIAYTGLKAMYAGPTEINGPYINGYVKVRAWIAKDMPPVVINMTTYIDNGTNSYRELTHRFGAYPDIVSVQIRLDNGFISDAQGTILNSRDVENLGGVVFGYDDKKIRLWAPRGPYHGVFAANDGWGLELYFTSGVVGILGWTADDYNQVFRKRFTAKKTAPTFRTMVFPRPYDLSNYCISIKVQIPHDGSHNEQMVFNAVGSSLASTSSKFGGIVYIYTENEIMFWFPKSSNGHFVYIGDAWGSGRQTQVSDIVDVIVKIYYLSDIYRTSNKKNMLDYLRFGSLQKSQKIMQRTCEEFETK